MPRFPKPQTEVGFLLVRPAALITPTSVAATGYVGNPKRDLNLENYPNGPPRNPPHPEPQTL